MSSPRFVVSHRARYVGIICFGAGILAASVIKPGEAVGWTLLGVHSTVYFHLLAYAGFAGTIGYGLGSTSGRAVFVAAAVSTLYGTGIELLQGAIPYRTMARRDVLVNALGAAIGAALWWLVVPRFDTGDEKPKERTE